MYARKPADQDDVALSRSSRWWIFVTVVNCVSWWDAGNPNPTQPSPTILLFSFGALVCVRPEMVGTQKGMVRWISFVSIIFLLFLEDTVVGRGTGMENQARDEKAAPVVFAPS